MILNLNACFNEKIEKILFNIPLTHKKQPGRFLTKGQVWFLQRDFSVLIICNYTIIIFLKMRANHCIDFSTLPLNTFIIIIIIIISPPPPLPYHHQQTQRTSKQYISWSASLHCWEHKAGYWVWKWVDFSWSLSTICLTAENLPFANGIKFII